MNKTIKDFIGKKVIYDQNSQMMFAIQKDGEHQMFLDLRGWGHIQNMFREGNNYDVIAAEQFQYKLGQWVVDTLNKQLLLDNCTHEETYTDMNDMTFCKNCNKFISIDYEQKLNK